MSSDNNFPRSLGLAFEIGYMMVSMLLVKHSCIFSDQSELKHAVFSQIVTETQNQVSSRSILIRLFETFLAFCTVRGFALIPFRKSKVVCIIKKSELKSLCLHLNKQRIVQYMKPFHVAQLLS